MSNGMKLVLVIAAVVGLCAPPSAEALLAKHDCSFCHDFHGAPSGAGLLKYSSTEVLCLTCHSTINGATDAAAPHNPRNLASNQQGYITCRECHDPHDNIGSNIKLVGYKYDPQNNRSFTASTAPPAPVIRVELTTSDPLNPVYKNVTFTSMPADYARADGKGPCQVCHASNHLIGKDCTLCHLHSKDFTGTIGFPMSGSCTSCHTGTGTDSSGYYSYDAYKIGPSGSHMKILATDSTNAACTACHTSHGAAPKVIIPNNTTVGINYTANGETGIALGGTATTGTTEAEICWNCHDQNNNGTLTDAGDISEWKGRAYLGYTITGSKSWVTATFDAPGALIPTRPVRSIHTANRIDTDATLDNVRSSSVAKNVNATTGVLAAAGSITLEQVKYIRCSYCHDVHNTYGPNKGDTISSGPGNNQTFTYTYLRGTWLPNTYVGYSNTGNGTDVFGAAEIPPWDHNPGNADKTRNSSYYGATGNYATAPVNNGSQNQPNDLSDNNWGHSGYNSSARTTSIIWNFPRLFATSRPSARQGGYFIDQNTGWPTRKADNTYMTVAQTAGICVLCHGGDVDTMNEYSNGTAELWRTDITSFKNGHANSTLGGSGTANGNDIFNARRDLGNTAQFGMQGQPIPDTVSTNSREWGKNTTLPGSTNTADTVLPFGYFHNRQWDTTGNYTPPRNTGWYGGTPGAIARTSAAGYTSWYTSEQIGNDGDGIAPNRAHNFSCSKCHTPHASGLPALLMTNCLDRGIATWVGYGRTYSNNTANVVGPPATYNWSVRAMGNCHYKSSTATGWNRLAPAQ